MLLAITFDIFEMEEYIMKLITVILRPEKEAVLKDVLMSIGYHGIASKDTIGLGEQKTTITQMFRGQKYEQKLEGVKRKEITFVVPDERVDSVIQAIKNNASTNQGGDGRIYISPLDDSIHIHSGDKHIGDSSEKALAEGEQHE
jgi:nitrogen regulatory protein PII